MKRLLLTGSFFMVFCYQSIAQFKISDRKALEKIKNGNTYVLVKELNFPQADEFLKVFKKYWTITKNVEFVTIGDLASKLTPEDNYFSLEVLHSQYTSGNMKVNNVYVYLDLWKCNENYFKKDRPFKTSDQKEIARVELSGDDQVYMWTGTFFENNDFDGGGHIFNWSPGLLKNYLQQLSILLLANKKSDLDNETVDKTQIKLLQENILYCSEDDLKKFSPFTGTGKSSDSGDIFEKYKYKYKIISNKELDKKLLDGNGQFYYLLFVRSSSSKIVTVVNSETGETIYSRVKGMLAYNLKEADLKTLSNEAQ
jgi:hypothetical protein